MSKKARKERKFKEWRYQPESCTFKSAEEWQQLQARVRRRWRKANPILVRSIVGNYGAKEGG